jgi:hypothetical protein
MAEKYKTIKLCSYKSLAETLVFEGVEGVEGRVMLMKGCVGLVKIRMVL